MSGHLGWLLRRALFGVLTVLAIAVITFGMTRMLRPELYPGTSLLGGTLDDLGRGFLHFDWGRACSYQGCPAIDGLFAREFAADLWLISGALALGIGAGLRGAMWCARHPGSRRTRAAEAVAAVLYCTPVFVVGYGLLLMFNPTFGLVGLPAFFDASPAWAQPWSDPWTWLRTLLVPWLVLAAPVAAMCLRLALGVLRDEAGADHVRTAYAKGLSPRRVMARHVAPTAYTATASFVAVSIPLIVLNLVLVEWVFGVPGFFARTYYATGHVPNYARGDPVIDIPLLQALAIWAALLIVVVGIAVDTVLVRIDPRVRGAGLPG